MQTYEDKACNKEVIDLKKPFLADLDLIYTQAIKRVMQKYFFCRIHQSTKIPESEYQYDFSYSLILVTKWGYSLSIGSTYDIT